MIATKTVDHVADLAAEQGYLERRPEYVTAVEIGRARTALFVPMLKENKLIGVFAMARQEVRPFTDKQIESVQNFAAQAVIAIENTRLLNELRQRTDELGRSVGELRALGEVSQAVNSTLDLETVLTTIVSQGGAALRHRRGRDLCVRRRAPGVSPACHLWHERDYDRGDHGPTNRSRRCHWGSYSAA